MPPPIRRLAPRDGCVRCEVQCIAHPVERASPYRRRCRQLPAGKKYHRAWILLAIAAVSIKPSARFAISLSWRQPTVVNPSLIPLDLHQSKSPPCYSPPSSDRAIVTLEGAPSARVSTRNCSNNSTTSDVWRLKYTHVFRKIHRAL